MVAYRRISAARGNQTCSDGRRQSRRRGQRHIRRRTGQAMLTVSWP